MITIHPKAADKIMKEPMFEIFKHQDLLCCIQRIHWAGNLNGYVAVPKGHPFYEKNWDDHVVISNKKEIAFNGNYMGLLRSSLASDIDSNLIELDLIFNVHCGLTYSRNSLSGIDKDLFGELWWFGFDTMHSGDVRPFQNEIDRKYEREDEEYRDFKYVKDQTKLLAEQLSKY